MAVFLCQARVSVRDVEADYENRQDVEDQDAPEDVAHHSWKDLRRVFGLSSGDGDGLSASVCERSGDEDGCETANAANKRRITQVEVPGADVLMVCVASTIDSDTEDDEYLRT